ncbi:hypothetical protein J6590_007115 [Homalodisca vitripennis]|nr:hypothetical protein J6590_007115 [Homalodisca vitripennis]
MKCATGYLQNGDQMVFAHLLSDPPIAINFEATPLNVRCSVPYIPQSSTAPYVINVSPEYARLLRSNLICCDISKCRMSVEGSNKMESDRNFFNKPEKSVHEPQPCTSRALKFGMDRILSDDIAPSRESSLLRFSSQGRPTVVC